MPFSARDFEAAGATAEQAAELEWQASADVPVGAGLFRAGFPGIQSNEIEEQLIRRMGNAELLVRYGMDAKLAEKVAEAASARMPTFAPMVPQRNIRPERRETPDQEQPKDGVVFVTRMGHAVKGTIDRYGNIHREDA